MNAPQTGYLVVADITGYTAYLSDSELEHARDSLNSFLELLVEHTSRPLLISRLEGDAVFSYAFDEQVPEGQILVDLIESTYVAFRKARQLMVINTTCNCRACANIPNLDLKFFLHHGRYAFQDVGDYKELVGTDVNLIHRLTKNTIVSTTGIRAYAAYTAAAIDAMGLAEFAALLTEHTEQYDHIGEVKILVQDLDAVWQQQQEAQRYEVRPDNTLYRIDAVFPLSPAELWPYITQPKYRAIVHGSNWQKLVEQPNGRIGLGAVYICSHSTYTSRNTIVDWHPFEQYTTVETTPVPRTFAYVTYLLEPVDAGSRLTYVASRAFGTPLLRQLSSLTAAPVLARRMSKSFTALLDYINKEIAAG
jgi:Protein of unknown function (DUF2652)